MFRGWMAAACGALWLAALAVAHAQTCSGCGCRGGPGYRGPDGHCTTWENIGAVCGTPPSAGCKAEHPAAPADAAAALSAEAAALAKHPDSDACTGCGCKGGPGYRAPNGQCVSWKTIGRVCGSPPTTRCTAEEPNGRADAIAAGAKGAPPPKPRPAKPAPP